MLAALRAKDFLSVLDFEPAELEACLALAARLKRERALGPNAPTAAVLAGAHVALLFDKPSLRTRSTFEIAIRELGGNVITPFPDVALGEREPAIDVARNLERWVKGAVIRTFAHRHAARVCEGGAAPPRGERAERSGASLPGAGRFSDASRTLGQLGRPDGRVRGRRQQRRHVARAGRRDAGRERASRIPARLRAAGVCRRPGVAGGAPRRADPAVPRSDRRREGRRRGLHRRLDVDGPGSGNRRSQEGVCRLPGDFSADAACGRLGPVPPLPARASRRRGVRRGV